MILLQDKPLRLQSEKGGQEVAGTYGGTKATPLPAGTADFYSDGKSIPPRQMREAALDAPLGDEQKGEDPTTTELLNRVAELLGKEDALFMPSATMANEIAVAVHCRPGDEIICERSSHIVTFEAGGPALLAGVQTYMVDGANGMFGPEQVCCRSPTQRQPVPPRKRHGGCGADRQHGRWRSLAPATNEGSGRSSRRGRSCDSHGWSSTAERGGQDRDISQGLLRGL